METLTDLFCGSADRLTTGSDFKPKSQPWDSRTLICNLDRTQIALPMSEIREAEKLLWNDLCSEYDAENFCNFLKEEKIPLSDDFKTFEYVWRRDEYNHYIGFRHIYATLYNCSHDDVETRLKSRPVDFTPIKKLLDDEFKICLLVAYDEIATTKSYATDYSFYDSFGHENFLKWIKRVTRDEAYHFNNCMELVGKNHYNRVKEIPELVDRFIEWDLTGGEYKGTFVLDHDGHYFTEEFLMECGKIMKRYFG